MPPTTQAHVEAEIATGERCNPQTLLRRFYPPASRVGARRQATVTCHHYTYVL